MTGPTYGYFDLHTHTTASDGVLTPTELVALALQRGLQLIAITDHDTTNGIAEAVSAAGDALEIWPGVEISTDVPRAEVHVLGYFVDPNHERFQETLRLCRESRVLRAQRMVERLSELGAPVEWTRVQELAGTGSVGRPHVAQALLERGYVENTREAFDRFIGRNGPAYVERYKLTPVEAVNLIQEAGGLPVLAHPTYITPGEESGFDLTAFVSEMTDAGLAGIECYYGDYPPETVLTLTKLAREFNLIPTGGSDFHGRGAYTTDIGTTGVPADTIERMRAWRETRK